MSKQTEIIICNTCKGIGIYEVREFKGHSRGYENQRLICLDCNGSGRKKRVITIIETPYEKLDIKIDPEI